MVYIGSARTYIGPFVKIEFVGSYYIQHIDSYLMHCKQYVFSISHKKIIVISILRNCPSCIPLRITMACLLIHYVTNEIILKVYL